MKKCGFWPDERESDPSREGRVLSFEEEQQLDVVQATVNAVGEGKMTVEEFDSKVGGLDMLRLMRWRPIFRKILLTIEEKRAAIKSQARIVSNRDPWDR